MANLPAIKQGDTFSYSATWEGAALEELKSQIRNSLGKLISDVLIESTETPGTFLLSVTDTNNWPVGTLFTDIQRTADGVCVSTDTMTFTVIKDVTQ